MVVAYCLAYNKMQTKDRQRQAGSQKHRHFQTNFKTIKQAAYKKQRKVFRKPQMKSNRRPSKTWKSLTYVKKKLPSISKNDLPVSKSTATEESWVEVEAVEPVNNSWCTIS